MIELIRKTKHTGIGFARMSREEIQALAKNLRTSGELSDTEFDDIFSIHKKLNSYLISSPTEERTS